MDYFIFIIVGYVLGAIPFGLIATKLVTKVDVRETGSGKTGMTNVIRVSGKKVGLAVLILDMSKAMIAIALARIFTDTPGAESAAGLAAIIGHMFPVFAGFRGGRAISTGWAGLIILNPWAGLIGTVLGLSVVYTSRYMSIGSMIGASTGCIALIIFAATKLNLPGGAPPVEYIWFGAIGGPIIVLRHYDNILRLIKGEERKFREG
jgi:glycerol-3-phosphate acyltransferase PlsY